MPKPLLLAAVAVVALVLAAPAQAVQITPDFSMVWVPWDDCVQVTVGTTQSYSTYEWTYDSIIVGHSSSYSAPTICNNGLSYTSYEDHSIAVYVTGGGSASYDSVSYTVYHEPGTPEYGGCGTEIICEECLSGQVQCN